MFRASDPVICGYQLPRSSSILSKRNSCYCCFSSVITISLVLHSILRARMVYFHAIQAIVAHSAAVVDMLWQSSTATMVPTGLVCLPIVPEFFSKSIASKTGVELPMAAPRLVPGSGGDIFYIKRSVALFHSVNLVRLRLSGPSRALLRGCLDGHINIDGSIRLSSRAHARNGDLFRPGIPIDKITKGLC